MTAFSAILIVHIVFGAAALAAGLAALALGKGSRWHRRAGVAFVATMLGMGVTGLVLALLHFNLMFIIISVFATYLALTGWRSARRGSAAAGLPEVLALLVVSLTTLGAAAAGAFGLLTGDPVSDLPPVLFLGFAVEGSIFAALDARVLRRGRLTGAARPADHLWRMIMALIFAAFAFFIANAHVLPAPLRRPWVTWMPVGLLFGTMIYWLIRVRWEGRPSERAAVPSTDAAAN